MVCEVHGRVAKVKTEFSRLPILESSFAEVVEVKDILLSFLIYHRRPTGSVKEHTLIPPNCVHCDPRVSYYCHGDVVCQK